jgi:hypothetical protein
VKDTKIMSLYYSARWVIEYHAVLNLRDVVYPMLLSTSYTLFVTKTIYAEEAEEGYNVICFVLRVPSENYLQPFIELVSSKLGIWSWQPSTEEVFLSGYYPPNREALPTLGDAFTKYGEMGRRNKELREKYAEVFRLFLPKDYELPWRD